MITYHHDETKPNTNKCLKGLDNTLASAHLSLKRIINRLKQMLHLIPSQSVSTLLGQQREQESVYIEQPVAREFNMTLPSDAVTFNYDHEAMEQAFNNSPDVNPTQNFNWYELAKIVRDDREEDPKADTYKFFNEVDTYPTEEGIINFSPAPLINNRRESKMLTSKAQHNVQHLKKQNRNEVPNISGTLI